MCKNFLTGLKLPGVTLLLSLLLLLLSWVAWPLPLHSGETGKTFTSQEWAQIQADFRDLSNSLENLKQINKAQTAEIQSLQTQLTEAKRAQMQLTEIIKNLQTELTTLKLNLTSLGQTLESNKTWLTVVSTIGGVSLLANIAQAVAYHYK